MTSPEHTLVGIHAAIAVGAHCRFGWTLIALAAIASNLPDWDGLPMLLDMSRFESGHRVWGHNIAAIFIASVAIAGLQYRYHFLESAALRFQHFLRGKLTLDQPLKDRSETGDRMPAAIPWLALFLICLVAQLLHLLCDMVVSGGVGLSDWPIQPFWPVSDKGYVLPLIPWGDIGPTVILMLGAIGLAKYPQRLRLQAALTLALLVIYLPIRGLSRGIV